MYRLELHVGRVMTMQSVIGKSVPSVRTAQFMRTGISPIENRCSMSRRMPAGVEPVIASQETPISLNALDQALHMCHIQCKHDSCLSISCHVCFIKPCPSNQFVSDWRIDGEFQFAGHKIHGRRMTSVMDARLILILLLLLVRHCGQIHIRVNSEYFGNSKPALLKHGGELEMEADFLKHIPQCLAIQSIQRGGTAPKENPVGGLKNPKMIKDAHVCVGNSVMRLINNYAFEFVII